MRSEIKAYSRCEATGQERPLCAVSADEFEAISAKNPDFRGIPVFYNEQNHSFVWPRLMDGYTANFYNGVCMFTLYPPIKFVNDRGEQFN